MQCKNSRLGKALIVELSGRLDTATAASFEDHCRQSIEPTDQALVLDLERLEYLSSAGLRGILAVAKPLKARGVSVAISKAEGAVRDVLQLSGFSTIFPLIDVPVDLQR